MIGSDSPGAPSCCTNWAPNADSRASMLALNRTCECWPVSQDKLRSALSPQVQAALGSAQAHLFADTGVFVEDADLYAMQQQIAAIESVAQLPGYLAAVAPTAGLPPAQAATRGALMGYDFHLTADGPRLIEVNTNAGGAFIVRHMSQRLGLVQPAGNSEQLAAALADMFSSEWQLAGRSGVPQSIAIVDESPEDQYLFSDMLLAADVLRERDMHVLIADPQELHFDGERLKVAGRVIDVVYNRLTDFALQSTSSAPLRHAWEADAVLVTPAPHHHARFARKTNLELLGNTDLLKSWGAGVAERTALAAIPPTVRVSAENADELWSRRKQLFFKPAAGFGGRAAYRGAKLTRRVWQQIVAAGGYVAQEFIGPAERVLAENQLLKFDVRVYTYAGQSLALVARVYQGQTTNFRTLGGGFAPVALLDSAAVDSAAVDSAVVDTA